MTRGLTFTISEPEAMFIYEFVINFDLEVTTVWQRKKTVISILLISIRWTMLANSFLLLSPTSSHSSLHGLKNGQRHHFYLSTFPRLDHLRT